MGAKKRPSGNKKGKGIQQEDKQQDSDATLHSDVEEDDDASKRQKKSESPREDTAHQRTTSPTSEAEEDRPASSASEASVATTSKPKKKKPELSGRALRDFSQKKRPAVVLTVDIEEDLALCYREHEFLYDKSNRDYMNREKKDNALLLKGTEYDITPADLEIWLKNQRDRATKIAKRLVNFSGDSDHEAEYAKMTECEQKIWKNFKWLTKFVRPVQKKRLLAGGYSQGSSSQASQSQVQAVTPEEPQPGPSSWSSGRQGGQPLASLEVISSGEDDGASITPSRATTAAGSRGASTAVPSPVTVMSTLGPSASDAGSQQHQQQFARMAAEFKSALTERTRTETYPDARSLAESVYSRGRSLWEAGDGKRLFRKFEGDILRCIIKYTELLMEHEERTSSESDAAPPQRPHSAVPHVPPSQPHVFQPPPPMHYPGFQQQQQHMYPYQSQPLPYQQQQPGAFQQPQYQQSYGMSGFTMTAGRSVDRSPTPAAAVASTTSSSSQIVPPPSTSATPVDIPSGLDTPIRSRPTSCPPPTPGAGLHHSSSDTIVGFSSLQYPLNNLMMWQQEASPMGIPPTPGKPDRSPAGSQDSTSDADRANTSGGQ